MRKLELELYGNPDVDFREVEINDSDDIIFDKKRFPFEAKKIAVLKIKYGNKKYCIHNPLPYKYDGATIPFGLGKGNPKYTVPALFHDLMCEDKSIIGYNRFLSSLVFYKLLRLFKVNCIWAFIMFLLVDTFQRFCKGWKK